jgi:hypothetical protein
MTTRSRIAALVLAAAAAMALTAAAPASAGSRFAPTRTGGGAPGV